MNAGEIDVNLGRVDDAIDCLVTAVDGFLDASSGTHLARSMSILASAERLAGRPEDAYRHLTDSGEIIAESDAPAPMLEFLGDAATVVAPDHPVTAAHILGAVRHAEARAGTLLGQPLLEDVAAVARLNLEGSRFEREFQVGRASELREVFEEVRSILDHGV